MSPASRPSVHCDDAIGARLRRATGGRHRQARAWSGLFADGYNNHVTAWVLVDSAQRCAQARRLDGRPWASIGGKKAKTLPGSEAAWPIGSADIGDKPFVALCEGGPDTLAAWSLAWWHGRLDEVAPVCVAGAGMSMHPESAPFFKGKGVWLFPHRDAEGLRAQSRWTAELESVGAKWVKPFDTSPSKDVNEWLTANVEGES